MSKRQFSPRSSYLHLRGKEEANEGEGWLIAECVHGAQAGDGRGRTDSGGNKHPSKAMKQIVGSVGKVAVALWSEYWSQE